MQVAVRTLVRRQLLRRGIAVGRAPRVEGLDQHLCHLINEFNIGLVLDVGANTGGYALRLRRVIGFQGLIRSFEPEDSCFRQLRQAASDDPRWQVRQLALGRATGVAELNVFPGHEDFNSFYQPSEFGEAHYPMRESRTQTVEVARLDDKVADLPDDPMLLKVDTQGHDMEVLAGAPATLARARVVQVEAPLRHLYKGTPTFPDYLAFLGDQGFAPTALFTAARGPGGELVEVDLVVARVNEQR